MLDKTIGYIILIPILIALVWNIYGYYLEKCPKYVVYIYRYTISASNYFIYRILSNEKRLIKHIYKEQEYIEDSPISLHYVEIKDKQIINMIETNRHISISDVFDIMVIDYVNKHLRYG